MDPGAQTSELQVPRPRTEDDLAAFLLHWLGIAFPKVACCEGHVAPWTAFCDAYFARSAVSVWKAARGFGGKSFMLAVLSWTEAVTLHASVNLLGGSGDQSERVHDYMRGFWFQPRVPPAILSSDPSARISRLLWGNTIKALQASQRSVRGPHPQRLRLDEVDVIAMPILEAALGQPIGAPGIPAQVVLSSTHQNPDGTMTAMLRRAQERGWPVFEWCWRETVEPHGWLPRAEVERARALMSHQMWLTEVELQEPSPEGRAVVPEKVEACFSLPLESRLAGPYVVGTEVEFEEPVEGAAYATGADWAKEVDYTEILTLRCDVAPMRVVAYRRGQRMPWPTMVGWLNDRLARYPGEAAHDATGVGNVVRDYIEHHAEDVVMAGKPRADLFTEWIAGIERDEVTCPRLDVLYQQVKYCRNADLFGSASKDHPPDGVVAFAMAYRASLAARVPMRLMSGTPRAVPQEGVMGQVAPQAPPMREADRSSSPLEDQVRRTGMFWPTGNSRGITPRAFTPDTRMVPAVTKGRPLHIRKDET